MMLSTRISSVLLFRECLQTTLRTFVSSSTFHCSAKSAGKGTRSGYESETAEIKESLRQFNLADRFAYDLDEEPRPAVLSHSKPMKSKKDKSGRVDSNEFLDYKRVRVRGGKGGDGMICFLSLYSNPTAGPSGGDGGHGGHVVFEACKDVKSLNHIKTTYNGLPGEKGQRKDMTGANAEHLIVKVPMGTLVKDLATARLIADMNQIGARFLAAKGGTGGKGNHYFLNNQNRHPRVAEFGAEGEVKQYALELKMIAHAGLVGFPNAGKSTLLSAVSRAKPRVASYPFTTLKPSVGVVHYDDGEQLAIADLPGLIEDAHLNRGLGVGFLRHIERCVCVFYVIDISASAPYEELMVLMKELESYKDSLATRPTTIILNKVDVEGTEAKVTQFRDRLKEDGLDQFRVIPVSAKYGTNLTELLLYFRELYDLHRFEKFHHDV